MKAFFNYLIETHYFYFIGGWITCRIYILIKEIWEEKKRGEK